MIRFGSRLRDLRLQAGKSQLHLAARAGLAERSLRRIEHGDRRTRASTLQRLADALVSETVGLGTAGDVMGFLLGVATPVLAPESQYRARVEARRRRREIRRKHQPVTEHCVEIVDLVGGVVLEHHRHRRWVTRSTVREHKYVVVRIRTLPNDAMGWPSDWVTLRAGGGCPAG